MTEQAADVLIYNGETTWVDRPPPLPGSHPRIWASHDGQLSTACWRGYIATWEIKDGRLYLVELSDRYTYRLEGEEPIFAEWFSGDLDFLCDGVTTDIPGPYDVGDGRDPSLEIVFRKAAKMQIRAGVVTKIRTRDIRPPARG